MPRLYLFAEGQTEQTFADIVLRPYLAAKKVYLHNPILIAHARKRGKVHRGGGRNYEPMKKDILRLLSQEKGRDVFFTTMIDLYAIHANFPGLDEAEKLRHIPEKRIESLEKSFAEDIADDRFVPYIQLHEYEAYLFADPSCFGYFYEHTASQIKALQAIADAYATPELIDDGLHTAPSKRIVSQFPDYDGAKSVLGPLIAQLIGLDTIRSKCPHFAAWLKRLEELGERR